MNTSDIKYKILFVDDEPAQRDSIAGFVRKKGYEVLTAESVDIALQIVRNEDPDLIITDYNMPNKNGADLLNELKMINPLIPVVLVTAYGTIENAVELMKSGAFDYLQKPIELKDLMLIIEKARRHSYLVSENLDLKKRLNEKYNFDAIVSNSPEMENAINTAVRVAKSKASIMVRGESGTGKELIAKAIHYSSERADKPFIVINCAAMPDTLFESELFGHEKGAFTGADKARPGKFEQADGGTLFIDEVGDIPHQVQVKLLRAVQFGEVQRLGAKSPQIVDVRIVTATNRNLEEMISTGEFREDLFYRFNVITINLPALRYRKSDIPYLIDFFTKKYADYNGKSVSGISKEALNLLMKHNFPGNVRELENIIHRAVVLTRYSQITSEDLPESIVNSEIAVANADDVEIGDLNIEVDKIERAMITKALNAANFNQVKAAAMLNISERTMRYKMQRLNISK